MLSRLFPGICTLQLALGIGLCGLSCQATATGYVIGDAAEFQATECWVKPVAKARTECGWLIVPEDWAQVDAQKIKLPVVIYHALNPDPALPPLVYLSGGPGIAALGTDGGAIRRQRSWADYDFPGRSLIVFDQRGQGLGSPRLECDDVDSPRLWYPMSNQPQEFENNAVQVREAYAACAARHLSEGRQLHAFNTRQSATDVEALRRVLELESMVLFGISYGTRLALTVMKFYPEHIHAAVLDSVWPPLAHATGTSANAFGPVLERLFRACREDAGCSAAYPDLRARLLRVLAQLKQTPVTLELTNLRGSEPLYARIDHIMFLEVLRSEMYHTARLPNLPMLISGVARGEHWRLQQPVESTVYSGWPNDFDMAATLAVMCNDEVDRAGIPSIDDAYQYLSEYSAAGRDLWPCAIWPTRPGTGNHEPVISDVPSLLLAGGLDAATTVEQAELAGATLSRSQLFVFPANAHVQIEYGDCVWELIAEFLSDPGKRLNPGCLGRLRRPGFISLGGN